MTWATVSLGEFAPFAYGKSLSAKSRRGGHVKVYGSNGVVGSHDTALVDGPGVIVGRKGSAGEVHFSKEPFWPIDTTFFVTGGVERDIRFVFYLLKSIGLQRLSGDSAVPGLNRDTAHSQEITVPDLKTQRQIALFLSSIDDLIENNRRRIEVLEEMAQAIYREWFVHFRFPGHENATFVDSPLGPIPEGWEVGELYDCLVLQRGFDLPTKQRQAGSVPIIGASGVQGTHSKARVEGPGICTGRSGTIGEVVYVPTAFWPLNTSLWVKEYKLATPLFAYFLLRSIDLKELAGGAAVPSLNRNHIHGLPVVLPPRELVHSWNSVAASTFDHMERLRLAAASFESIRDLLLPKLVTGEIDVSELDLGVLVEAVS